MKLYVQPLFSDNHSTGSIIKKLGSSDYTFSSIRIMYKEKSSVKSRIINLNELFKLSKTERLQISKQIKNIEISRKKIAGLRFSKPLIMGILNVTPDSFSDGGIYTSKKTAIDHVIKMIKSGADIIDIGGESTRPGSEKVKIEEELKRVLPILNNISNLKNKVPISLDTRKPEVMMKGLKKGVVINIDSTIQAIQRAIEEAELMADCKIKDVYTGIAGNHIKSLNSHGMVKVKDSEVSQMDIDRVFETAQAITLPPDQQVLHVLTQEYILDDQHDIKEPLGMSGMRLEVKVHIVSGAIAAAQNIVKCIKRCGLDVLELVLQPLASSEAVLTKDEKELGVCLVDIGGGTTDIAIIKNGSIQHTAVIPIAGDQITNDIAVAFTTPYQSAEDIKINHGSAVSFMASINEIIEIPLVSGMEPKKVTTQALSQVIEPRVSELFELIRNELQRSRLGNEIASGIVITGGSSMMKGMVNLGETIFNMPVRIGLPRDVDGLLQVVENPRYATGIGLLKMGRDEIEDDKDTWTDGNILSRLSHQIKTWFHGNF